MKTFLLANENIEKFTANLDAGLFRFFDFENIRKTEDDGYIQLLIEFKGQHLMEEVTDQLERMLLVKVLHAYKTVDGKEYHAIAYPTPNESNLFVLFLNSYEYGIANFMIARFYDSLDMMFTDLAQFWRDRGNKDVTLEITKTRDFIMDFF